MRTRARRTLAAAALGVAAVAVLLQLLPFGRPHANPPVTADAPWPDARSEALARASCYDCHSNQSRWPLYSYVAPFSWLVTRDVEQGREKLNFSTWDQDGGDADDAAEAVSDGSMPPRRYLPLHRDAALSDAERRLLADALIRMDAGGGRSGRRGGEGGG